MPMNELYVVQNTSYGNGGEMRVEYHFYTPSNIYLGAICMPGDGQYAFDTKMLGIITRALAIRWRIIPMPKKL